MKLIYFAKRWRYLQIMVLMKRRRHCQGPFLAHILFHIFMIRNVFIFLFVAMKLSNNYLWVRQKFSGLRKSGQKDLTADFVALTGECFGEAYPGSWPWSLAWVCHDYDSVSTVLQLLDITMSNFLDQVTQFIIIVMK